MIFSKTNIPTLIVIILIIIIIYFQVSSNTYYFQSADKEHGITVIDYWYSRKIYDGRVFFLNMNSKYVKLDISETVEDGDVILVCWRNQNYVFELICPDTKIIKNNLDNNLYKIRTDYELDSEGRRNISKYHQEGCFEFDFEYKIVSPESNAILY